MLGIASSACRWRSLSHSDVWGSDYLSYVCLLVCSSAVNEEASAQLTKGPGLPESLPCSEARCPGKRKAATLVPSFTKSTTAPAQPTTHSSTKPPTTPSRTTAHHTQLPPGNRTTAQTTHTTPGHHPTAHGNRTTAPAGGTTPHPPTTAPLPTELPFVPVGDYEAKNGSATCLRMQMGLQIQVQYTSKAKQQVRDLGGLQGGSWGGGLGGRSSRGSLRANNRFSGRPASPGNLGVASLGPERRSRNREKCEIEINVVVEQPN